jgi:uncharacterized surface anchored protein
VVLEDVELLPKGNYYLSEKSTLDGYALLGSDVLITLNGNGTISAVGPGTNIIETSDETNVEYSIEIENSIYMADVSFKKVDFARPLTSALPNACFELQMRNPDNDSWEKIAELQSNHDGLCIDEQGISRFQLMLGDYRLVETSSPDGYETKDQPIEIFVRYSGVSYDEHTMISASGLGIDKNGSHTTLLISNKQKTFLLPWSGISSFPVILIGSLLIVSGMVLWKVRRHPCEIDASETISSD